MDLVELAGNAPGFVVAATLGALALAVLLARPRDRLNRLFAAYLGLVALNYLLVHASNAVVGASRGDGAREGAAHALLVAAYLVQVADTVALFHLAALYPRPNRLSRAGPRSLVWATTLLFAGALLAAPASVLAKGTPARLAFDLYVNAVYALALASFVLAEVRRPAGAPPSLPHGFLLGWSVVVLYRLYWATLVPTTVTALGGPWPVHTTTALFAQPLAFLGLAAITLALAAIATRGGRPERRGEVALVAKRTLVIAGALTLVFYARDVWLVATYSGSSPPSLEARPVAALVSGVVGNATFASRWLVFAAVAGPGFLHAQVLGLEPRFRRAVVAAGAFAAFFALFVLALVIVEGAVARGEGLPAGTVLVLVALVLAATQAAHLARWVGNRLYSPEKEASEGYRRLRRMEVYRAALEAVRLGRAPASDLPTLRDRLGLTEAEARLADAMTEAPRSAIDVAPGVVLVDRYEIERVVGRGAHGRVFLARDRKTRGSVALKELAGGEGSADGSLRRAESEVLTAARIDHPRLVTPRDYFLVGSTLFLVLPYMPGGSLADVLRERGRLSPKETATIARDVLLGLGAAHAKGVLHRDVKPSNVLLDGAGRGSLSDFGIAHLGAADRTATSVFAASVPGTRAFLPPEAFDGEAPDATWDVYAVGALVEACLGEARGPDADRLRAVARKARAPERAARYASAREMLAAVEPFAAPVTADR